MVESGAESSGWEMRKEEREGGGEGAEGGEGDVGVDLRPSEGDAVPQVWQQRRPRPNAESRCLNLH